MAAGGNDPPLMEGQGAEVARPEAPAVVGHRKAYLLDGGHAAHRVIHGVGFPHVGQLRHKVQLRRGQRHGGRGDHQQARSVALEDGAAPDRIVLLILNLVGLRIGALVAAHLFKRRALHLGIDTRLRAFCNKGSSLYICDLFHRSA